MVSLILYVTLLYDLPTHYSTNPPLLTYLSLFFQYPAKSIYIPLFTLWDIYSFMSLFTLTFLYLHPTFLLKSSLLISQQPHTLPLPNTHISYHLQTPSQPYIYFTHISTFTRINFIHPTHTFSLSYSTNILYTPYTFNIPHLYPITIPFTHKIPCEVKRSISKFCDLLRSFYTLLLFTSNFTQPYIYLHSFHYITNILNIPFTKHTFYTFFK